MAQMKTFTWTNPASVAGFTKLVPLGFQADEVRIYDQSNYASTGAGVLKHALWISSMASGSALVTNGDAALYTAANGVTITNPRPPSKTGSDVSAFTNANTGVITVADGSLFRVGDVIKVAGAAESRNVQGDPQVPPPPAAGSGVATGKSLNRSYTITAINGNALTIDVDTRGTGQALYKQYLRGGFATIVSRLYDGELRAFAVTNQAVGGVSLGSSVVGAANSTMLLVAYGANPVD